MLQIVADGLILGSVIALGAIGLSLTLQMARFSNFCHGELMAWGAYVALMAKSGGTALGLAAGMAAAAGLALGLDAVLFRRLRKQGPMTLTMASFGAALVLRNVLLFWQGGAPKYYTETLEIARVFLPRNVWGGLRFTADQLLVVGLTLGTVSGLHLFLRHSVLGRAMRASALNPELARATGIDAERVSRAMWTMSGGLAALGGVFAGLTVQLRPTMGGELLLPLFAAAILGGVGSVWGAVLGGFIVGVAESAAVALAGAEYRAAAAFAVLIAILVARPNGLFGERA